MLHLIPEHQKDLVLTEYHKRLGIAGCLFALCIIGMALILLLPAYIVAQGRYAKVEEKRAQIEKNLSLISTTQNGDAVKDVDNRIAALAPLNNSANPSVVFDDFLLSVTPGIVITHYGYVIATDKSLQLQVEGRSSSREELLAFAESVNNSGKFSGVRVPLSSLRNDKDIPFSFKLGVKIPAQ